MVLFGFAHVADPALGLPERLERQGHPTVVLVPYLPRVMRYRARRHGGTLEDDWVRLLPGVLAPPYVTAEDLVAESEGGG